MSAFIEKKFPSTLCCSLPPFFASIDPVPLGLVLYDVFCKFLNTVRRAEENWLQDSLTSIESFPIAFPACTVPPPTLLRLSVELHSFWLYLSYLSAFVSVPSYHLKMFFTAFFSLSACSPFDAYNIVGCHSRTRIHRSIHFAYGFYIVFSGNLLFYTHFTKEHILAVAVYTFNKSFSVFTGAKKC